VQFIVYGNDTANGARTAQSAMEKIVAGYKKSQSLGHRYPDCADRQEKYSGNLWDGDTFHDYGKVENHKAIYVIGQSQCGEGRQSQSQRPGEHGRGVAEFRSSLSEAVPDSASASRRSGAAPIGEKQPAIRISARAAIGGRAAADRIGSSGAYGCNSHLSFIEYLHAGQTCQPV
jgi:hypothetical protein